MGDDLLAREKGELGNECRWCCVIPSRSSDAGPLATKPMSWSDHIDEAVEDLRSVLYRSDSDSRPDQYRVRLERIRRAKEALDSAEAILVRESGGKPDALSIGEQATMRETFRVTMMRAADVIEKITRDDVTEMQMRLMAAGKSLSEVAPLDRLHVAVAHLRAIAQNAPKGFA